MILPTYTTQGNQVAARQQRTRNRVVSTQSPALALQLGAGMPRPVTKARTGNGMGSIGSTLYDWTPDFILGAACPAPGDSTIISDSACDRFWKAQAALYPPPPLPVTVKPPAGALDDITIQNPPSKEAAQAVIDQQIAQQVQAQQNQTAQFFSTVVEALEADRRKREEQSSSNLSWLAWGALGLVGVGIVMRVGGR